MAYTKIRTSTQVNIDANLDAQNHKLVNVTDPSNPQDAATKAYVDSQTSGLTAANFVHNEVPSGTVDGANAAFTLANTPTVGSVQVFLNGLLQKPGVGKDYTVSAATITFVAAPLTGDLILAHYMK
jgi:flagellar hook protein FlgE